MPFLRAIACFIVLVLLASPPAQAQAGREPLQSSHAQTVFSTRHPTYGGRCPHLCVQWFDGCNNCTCNRSGRLDACTQQYCFWRGRPRCITWGF